MRHDREQSTFRSRARVRHAARFPSSQLPHLWLLHLGLHYLELLYSDRTSRLRRSALLGVAFVVLTGCAGLPRSEVSDDAAIVARAGAPLFAGMGEHHHTISTRDTAAQRYFDQGMTLAFAFNHAESTRSFAAAQRLDPTCAMCFWGEALAIGPNINVTSNGQAVMSAPDRIRAFAALEKAQSLATGASEQERGYIRALAHRYNGDPETDRAPLDRAYADAMRALAEKYPEDLDAAALYAEAEMNTMPWNYWADDGAPRPATTRVIDQLERVLGIKADHPLALHLYIHAVEASSNPARAEAAADRLRTLIPGAGHLVHMPAHIYWRVGRYHDASAANIEAARVDEAYIAACNAQGFYPALYYPHNIHFLWAAATMEGRREMAFASARRVVGAVPLDLVRQFKTVEFFRTPPLLTMVRFGAWDEILDEPQPPSDMNFHTAIWHYARAVAFAATGNSHAAQSEQTAIEPLRKSVNINFLDTNDFPASQILLIAEHLAKGEIALRGGDPDSAIVHFERAVTAQDELPYTEPPFWYYPTRQSLGRALLVAGRHQDAIDVYRRDLADYPRNGWSLVGLANVLRESGRAAEAARVAAEAEVVLRFADISITDSVF